VIHSSLAGHRYLSLETRRKDGRRVTTPVWFAEDDGVLWTYSLADAGKVKRIRNFPDVRIAPCDIRGRLKGDWVAATATVVSGAEFDRGMAALDRKYGWQKKLGDWFRRARPKPRAVIAIRPL
jgi:PPOX class probable F420-dependent enzyme